MILVPDDSGKRKAGVVEKTDVIEGRFGIFYCRLVHPQPSQSHKQESEIYFHGAFSPLLLNCHLFEAMLGKV